MFTQQEGGPAESLMLFMSGESEKKVRSVKTVSL